MKALSEQTNTVTISSEMQDHAIHMTDKQQQAFNRQGYRVVFGGVLIHLVLGTFYLWGGISIYVASYLRHYDPDITIDLVKGVFPFMMITINAGMSLGVKLANRFGPKIVIGIAMLVFCFSTFVCGFITSFIPFFAVYAGLIGFSSGIIYMVPVNCGWRYFPTKKGKVSGFIIGGYGLGSFIFNFIALALVNPNNDKPTVIEGTHKYFPYDGVAQNVPFMLKVLGACYLGVGMLGTFLVRNPENKYVEHHDEHDILTKEGEKKKVEEMHHDCHSIGQGIKAKPFWIMFIMVICGTFFGYLMANNYKVYGLTKIPDDAFVTLCGSIGSLANGSSRAIWAAFYDRFGFKRVYFVLLTLQALLCATLNSVSEVKALYLVFYCLIMSCEGGQISMYPAVTAKVFGSKVGSLIYGFMFAGYTITNISSYLISTFALGTLGWPGLFWICFGFTICAMILNFIFNERKDYFK